MSNEPTELRPQRNWSVWRLDDNDNEFVVQANLSEQRARALAQELEDRGHKQTYWAKQEPSAPS
ncbi:MAG: hypothetical protein AAF351_03210 [Pseudomonadota bacterium]